MITPEQIGFGMSTLMPFYCDKKTGKTYDPLSEEDEKRLAERCDENFVELPYICDAELLREFWFKYPPTPEDIEKYELEPIKKYPLLTERPIISEDQSVSKYIKYLDESGHWDMICLYTELRYGQIARQYFALNGIPIKELPLVDEMLENGGWLYGRYRRKEFEEKRKIWAKEKKTRNYNDRQKAIYAQSHKARKADEPKSE